MSTISPTASRFSSTTILMPSRSLSSRMSEISTSFRCFTRSAILEISVDLFTW